MAVNYNDERFAKVEADKQSAMNNANNTYDNMVNQTDAKYNELIQSTKDYATTQQQIQQDNTNFAIEQINQQKDKAEKDYIKEQKASYVDYQKATDQYGVNAEQLAQNGMSGTGYAETSKINAFTTYQNRYATARESFNQATLNYDNAIKDAQLKNNAQLAEIAFKALQTELEYALQGFQYKNELLQTKLNTQIQLDSEYNNRYQQVLSQINTENSLAEQIRQYNETMAFQKEQAKQEQANWEKQYALSKASVSGSRSSGSSSSGSASLKKGSSKRGGSESGSSSNLTSGSSKSSTSKAYSSLEKTLSSMYKISVEPYGKNTTMQLSGKQKLRTMLSTVYKQGQITDSEFQALAGKFGL